MFCPNCGTDAGEAKFCPECGAKIVLTSVAENKDFGETVNNDDKSSNLAKATEQQSEAYYEALKKIENEKSHKKGKRISVV